MSTWNQIPQPLRKLQGKVAVITGGSGSLPKRSSSDCR